MLNRVFKQLGFCFFTSLSLSQLRVFSHAFATPVTTLALVIDTLENQLGQTAELKTAKLATQRLRDLLILAASTSKEIDKSRQPFNLIQALNELKGFFWSKELTLVVSNTLDQSVTLFGEKLLFQEALVNLIKNAFEAYLPKQDGLVLVSAHQETNRVLIEVVDFASHQKGQVMPKPFGGWGVGLAFARKVLKKEFQAQFKLEVFKSRGAHAHIEVPLVNLSKHGHS